MKKAVKYSVMLAMLTLCCLHCTETSAAFIPKSISHEPELEEDIEEEEWDKDLDEEDSQEEIDAIIEQYFQEMETAQLPDGQQEIEKIVNPELLMEAEDNGKLSYRFPNMGCFTSTVPNGMISSQPVEITLSSGCAAVVDCDGTSSTLTSSRWFTESGNYHIRILSYQSPDESVQDYDLYEANLYFIITESPNSRIGAVPAPENFEISYIALDGESKDIEDPRCLFLTRDGQYTIEYTARDDENIRFETSLVRDTTAPFLSFSQELEEGTAYGMLEFYPSEEGCRVFMNYNGEQGYAVSNQLTVAGYYRLVIEDAAGNRREYSLRIKPNYRILDARMIAMGVILLLAVSVWMFFQRRNMRVL